MAVTVLLVGAFDTKGPEYAFLRERILADGIDVLTLNTGVLGSTELFPVDIEAALVATEGGSELSLIREKKDRGEAMRVMADGVEYDAQVRPERSFK